MRNHASKMSLGIAIVGVVLGSSACVAQQGGAQAGGTATIVVNTAADQSGHPVENPYRTPTSLSLVSDVNQLFRAGGYNWDKAVITNGSLHQTGTHTWAGTVSIPGNACATELGHTGNFSGAVVNYSNGDSEVVVVHFSGGQNCPWPHDPAG